ncbi:MAG TPA: hypothetical protein VE093_28705 [Polyangiaceae bacterium]|nr:hypothetical protein [Polyangiaceae bacterium]
MEALASRLPDILVPPDDLLAAQTFAAPLPPCWDWVMLETRLGPRGGPVDLLASVTEAGTGRARMREALNELTPDAEARLSGVLPLLRTWAAGAPPVDTSGVVFLEWDAPLQGAARGPLAFLSIDPSFWRADNACAERRTDVDLLPWALAPGAATPEWTPLCAAVGALLGALPEQAFGLCAVSTAPRGHDAARVFVRMAPWQVGPWLRAAGWPGDSARVERWAQALYRPWETAFVQMELRREGNAYVPGPYLGLEPSQTTASYGERASRARWLDAAIAAGIVHADQARAVLDWPGAWVGDVGSSSGLICTSYHLKLVLNGGQESAKAYLGAHVRAVPAGGSD